MTFVYKHKLMASSRFCGECWCTSDVFDSLLTSAVTGQCSNIVV